MTTPTILALETSKTTSEKKFIRYLTGVLLAFLALNAFGGGYYGMSGAEGVPLDLLEGSPFNDYFIPGLFLFVAVGGSFLFAAIAFFARWRIARKASFFAALLVLAWLVVQVRIIGYISWMQPVTAGLAILILLLTWILPKEPAPEEVLPEKRKNLLSKF